MQVIQFPTEKTTRGHAVKVMTSSQGAASGCNQADGIASDVVAVRRPVCIHLLQEQFVHEAEAPKKRAAEPIKDIRDIIRIQDYLIDHKRYRDNLIFTMGINLGLRCGDLLQLRVGHIIEDDGSAYRRQITLIEEKTGKRRVVYMNESIMDAADLYFQSCGVVTANDYLFQCESNFAKNSGEHLTVRSVERMLKEVINDELGIKVHASTHCLRKTFAYHVIQTAPDRSRAIEFLQKILGHSSPAITLRYAGITDEEIYQTYSSLNLGRRNPFGFVVEKASSQETA